jgi:hypothetical protein
VTHLMRRCELIGQKRQGQNKPSIVHIKGVDLIGCHAKSRPSGIIPFCEVRKVLAWLYHLDRLESRQFIGELRFFELISYHPYHGIKLLEREGYD